jgi:hypothetical protein
MRSLRLFAFGALGLSFPFTLRAQPGDGLLEALKRAPVYSPGLNLGELPEVSLEMGASPIIQLHGELAVLDASGHLEKKLAAPHLASEGMKLKYRAGQFWASQGDSIQVFVPDPGAWVPRLVAPRAFKDFEITFDGRIVLMDTEAHLAEFYRPITREPEAVLDYPVIKGFSRGVKPVEYPKFFWQSPVSALVDEYLVLYFPNLGRMYRVNLLEPACVEVDVPWSCLDLDQAAQVFAQQGFITVAGRPTFNSIQLIPESSTTLRIAYQLSDAVYALKAPPAGDPRPKLVEVRASTERGFHWCILDLAHLALGQVHDEPKLTLPRLPDASGAWVRPEHLLKPESVKAGAPSGE